MLCCRSTDYGDELTWAAAWLYKATDDPLFLDEAEHHYMKFRLKERPNEFFYNKKVAGVQVCCRCMVQRNYRVYHLKRNPTIITYYGTKIKSEPGPPSI
jgi:hypothetical protein